MSASASEPTQRVEALERQVDSIHQDLSGLKTNVASLQTTVGTMDRSMNSMRTEIVGELRTLKQEQTSASGGDVKKMMWLIGVGFTVATTFTAGAWAFWQVEQSRQQDQITRLERQLERMQDESSNLKADARLHAYQLDEAKKMVAKLDIDLQREMRDLDAGAKAEAVVLNNASVERHAKAMVEIESLRTMIETLAPSVAKIEERLNGYISNTGDEFARVNKKSDDLNQQHKDVVRLLDQKVTEIRKEVKP